jgi:hypothetical protein
MIIWALVRSSSDSSVSRGKAYINVERTVFNHVTMRTLGNIDIESSQSKIGLQVTGFGLNDAVCMGEKNWNKTNYGERTLTESA